MATTLPSSCAICAVAFSFAPVIWTWTTAAVSDEESRSLLEATACSCTEYLKRALRQVQGAHIVAPPCSASKKPQLGTHSCMMALTSTLIITCGRQDFHAARSAGSGISLSEQVQSRQRELVHPWLQRNRDFLDMQGDELGQYPRACACLDFNTSQLD